MNATIGTRDQICYAGTVLHQEEDREFPRVADLGAIAAELAVTPKYESIGKRLQTAAVAQSCVGDLRQAVASCGALGELLRSTRKIGSEGRAVTEHALLMLSISLYARATAVQAKMGERGPITIISHLTPDQRADHDAIVAVRNRAYSHVYTGEEVSGQVWNDNLLYLVEQHPNNWRPGVLTQRVELDKLILSRLERQLPVAVEIILGIFHRRMEAFAHELAQHPDLFQVLFRHQVEPEVYFGSLRAARLALEGLGAGEIHGRGPPLPRKPA